MNPGAGISRSTVRAEPGPNVGTEGEAMNRVDSGSDAVVRGSKWGPNKDHRARIRGGSRDRGFQVMVKSTVRSRTTLCGRSRCQAKPGSGWIQGLCHSGSVASGQIEVQGQIQGLGGSRTWCHEAP